MAMIWLIYLFIFTACNPISAQDSAEDDSTTIQPYLLLANTFDIRRLNFDGTDYRFLIGGLSGTVALDYDYTISYMYWSHTDGQTKKISRAPLETASPVEDIITTNLGEPGALAIDWVNRKIYWTDGALNLIEKANLDGSQRGVVISSGTNKPRGIALDPHNNRMYFTDVSDTTPSIQKAHMADGYYREVIVTGGLARPNALTIDLEKKRLYFADAQMDRIESCKLDGSDRRLILDRPSTFHPYGLSVYKDRLFWSDVLEHHIMHIDKETGLNGVKMEGYFAYPTALHTVHPSKQLLENRNWCEANNGLGPCHHVCHNTYDGYECTCSPGYQLNGQEACQDVNECSLSNGGCNHHCINTEGSYECKCIGGFSLLLDGVTCADLDECHTGNAGCQYTCHNTESGYYCSCPVGFALTTDQHQCIDIDECLQHPCPAEGYCVNEVGTYTCYCSQGYQYNTVSKTCQDVDECVSGQNSCSQLCVNQPSSYRCECHSGFVLPVGGVSCIDTNECELGTDGCDQRCTNVMGSYVCSCLEGFFLNNDKHTCAVINCGQPEPIPGFSISCHGDMYGNTCGLTCDQGDLIGNPIITCSSNSQWSVATAECITTTVTSWDENEPPIRVYLSSNTIPEDATIDSIVGTINAIDRDPSQTFTFTVSGAVHTFYINHQDDTLRIKAPLNFESTSSFSVFITATDSGTPALSVTSDITILVLNVNEQPSRPTITNSYISEHINPGDAVGQLQASDPDTDQIMTFALLSSADGKFDVDGDTVIVAGKINYEFRHIYYITVLVTDNGQPAQTNMATITIQVFDSNDKPTDITLTPDMIPEATIDSGTATGSVIGVLSTVDEDIWDSHIYTLSGENSACFDISVPALYLLVQNTSCFDFESNPIVEITLISADRELKMVERTLYIKLTDAAEAPTAIVLSSNIMREHSEPNTVLGVLTVLDPDYGDSHTFFIGSETATSFKVEGNKLVVYSDLSYTNYPSGTVLSLAASDTAGKVFSRNYIVFVQDVNEPPGQITWDIEQRCVQDQTTIDGIEIHACIDEEHTTGAVIARPLVTDPDGDQLTWTILDSSQHFNIERDGTVRVSNKRLNYEVFKDISHGSVQSVVIVAMDSGGYTTSSQLNIEVLNINDTPRRVLISNSWVASNAPVGQDVATLTCEDDDHSDQHSFRFVYPISYFNIVGSQLQVATTLQGQEGNHITVYIACSDNVQEIDPGYTVINIIDIGPPNDISVTLSPNYLIENSPVNQVIGTVRAYSPSSPDVPYRFRLITVFEELFSLSIRPGESNAVDLVALWPFDYEAVSTQNVVILAVSSSGTSMEHFTISILNVNEPPANITLTEISVPENQVGALAGIISAVDPETDDMEFVIVDDPANAFQLGISNTRELVTIRELDYETEPLLTVTISVTDTAGSGQSTSRTLAISVYNVNEAPSRIEPRRFEVKENSRALTAVGTLIVTDLDDAHTPQRIECHLKDDGGGLFIVSGTEIQVAETVFLDYESLSANRKTITVTVECYDQGQLSATSDIDMVIIDVNEAPTDIVSQTGLFEIEENNAGGSTLATLLTIDPETREPAAGRFTYTGHAPLTFPFAVIGDRIIVHQKLDYEEKRFYDMEITTTDSGDLTFTKTIRIKVLDGNDVPTAIVIATTAKIFEHSTSSTPISTLTAIDEDYNQEHFFMIESQTPEGALQIVNGTQLVVGNTDIDYELTDTVSVTIKVTDIGISHSELFVDTFTLEVKDVNEQPTGIRLSANIVSENSPLGTKVGQIIVDDPDTFDQMFYCYLGFDGTSRFQIANQGDDIWLQVGFEMGLFDYEQVQSVTVTIWCRDSNPEYFIQETLTIQIEDANDALTGLIFMDAAKGTFTTNASQPMDPIIFGNVITVQTVTIREDAPVAVGVVCYIFVLDEDAVSGAEPAHHSAVVKLISQDEYNQIINSQGRRRRSQERIYSRSRRQAIDDASDDFVIQSGTNYLLVSNKLDHETKDEYFIYFKAFDPEVPEMIVASLLRVVVLDVDEAPQNIELTSTTVAENSPINTKIGDVSIVDPDGTKTGYAYSMLSLGTPFYIIGTSLHVERHPLDYEVTPTISIQIQVREIATTLTIAKTFHVSVTDIPEPPTSLTVNGNITVWVPETVKPLTSLGTLMADDPDHDKDGMTFTFFRQQPSEFQIEGDQLILVQTLDSWERRLYDLPMQVADETGLTFRRVIFVRVTEEDRCRDPNYCSHYATCVHNRCTCNVGFVGDGNSCTDYNECVPNPCNIKNSYGTCENGIGGLRNYTCGCKSGWTGPECTNQVDECVDNLCNEQGTMMCQDKLNTYACVCKDGFTGLYCDENIDDCAEHSCRNGGECVDGVSGYTCDCLELYVGLLCETDSSICTNIICPYNGTCIPVPNESRTVCRCLEPYAADCQGCSYGYGGPGCLPCNPPYTGVNCLVDSTVCDPNPCSRNNICIPYYDQFACICPANETNCEGTITQIVKSSQVNWVQTTGGLSSLLVASVALLTLIVLLLGLLYCRKLRSKPKLWNRARYNSESQQVIIDTQELGITSDDMGWTTPGQAPNTQPVPQYNKKNNTVSVKVSNDLHQSTNPSKPLHTVDGDQAVADLVGAIAKPLGSRGRQISMAKNNLNEWDNDNLAHNEGDMFDTVKKENLYVDISQRELPVSAVAFKNKQYVPAPGRHKRNSSSKRYSPRKKSGNHGNAGIEDSIATDNRQMHENLKKNKAQDADFLKDNPVFQGSDDEDEMPTSII